VRQYTVNVPIDNAYVFSVYTYKLSVYMKTVNFVVSYYDSILNLSGCGKRRVKKKQLRSADLRFHNKQLTLQYQSSACLLFSLVLVLHT